MKYNAQITEEICKYIRAGNSHKDAAELANINEKTFYRWKDKASFASALKKAESECKARNIAIIQQAATRSWQAAAWWLERKYNNEFALKQISEVKGDGRSIELFINLGSGFVPATLRLPTPSVGSLTTRQSSLQSAGVASES